MIVMKSVREADVKGKRVLVRVDFDVPLENGKVADDTRIKASLDTINLLHDHGAKAIILLAHLHRPGGEVDESLRIRPVSERLQELTTIPFDLRENLRFDPRERQNDETFAKELAALGDVYVNEAFSNSHRVHASMVGIPKLLPSYAGLRLEEEINQLSIGLTPPEGSIAIVGGAKLETKLPLINKLSKIYNKVFVGGALSNELTNPAANVFLPEDGVPELVGMSDIGPKTIEAWVGKIKGANFVLWNGPVGMYEKEEYQNGTNAIARAISESDCRSIIGGGDTVAAVSKYKFDSKRIFVSTGGGAMLQFLVDGTLPALEALKR